MEKRRTVVLADANEEYRALLADAIEKTGEFHVVGIAADGVETLRSVEQEKPDFLLIDLILPHMDGLSVLSKLKKQEDGGPTIIALSSFCSQQTVAAAGALGAAAFMVKPCTDEAILENMRLLQGSKEEEDQGTTIPTRLSRHTSCPTVLFSPFFFFFFFLVFSRQGFSV